MADKEIIKALECIAREAIECAECPYGEYCYPTCQNVAGGDALDLINRQKAEIERLEIEVVIYSKKNYIKAIKDFAERLKELINPDWCKIHQQIDNLVKEMIGEQE